MRKSTRLIAALLSIAFFGLNAHAQLLVENFNYPGGDSLSDHGWTTIRYGEKIVVTSPGLEYTGYALSGIGNAATLRSNGEELMKTFVPQTDGALFVSFLVNVQDATDGSDNLIMYFGATNTSIFSRGFNVYASKNSSGKVSFAVGKIGISIITDYIYDLNTTYLIVIKYQFNPGAIPDRASIWINPPLNAAEPPADKWIDDGDDIGSLSEIVLTQISDGRVFTVDGIQVTSEWPLLPSEVLEDERFMPQSPELFQNYPNPFNPMTEIRYSINEKGHALLSIHDLRGRLLRTLENSIQQPGLYSAIWDGRDSSGNQLPSGVYLLIFKAGNYAQSRKALLLR